MKHSSTTTPQKTWIGQISDSMCGATHKKMDADGHTKLSDRECTLQCVKDGAQYVFIDKGKVIPIENQDFAALPEHAGHTAEVTGILTGDRLRVTAINIPAKLAR